MSHRKSHNLCIVRSVKFDPFFINCTQEGTEDPIDLTGWKAHAKARLTHIPSRIVDLSPDVVEPTEGVIAISLTGVETMAIPEGLYEWDLIIENQQGERHGPIVSGRMEVVTPATMP